MFGVYIMVNDFPIPIVSEKDLTVYEDYLKNDNNKQLSLAIKNKSHIPETLTNPVFLPAFLKNHIGKLVKIESLIGDCLQARVGTLLQVGADFVVIKLNQNCSSMVIEGRSIKFITIIHDNDSKKINCF